MEHLQGGHCYAGTALRPKLGLGQHSRDQCGWVDESVDGVQEEEDGRWKEMEVGWAAEQHMEGGRKDGHELRFCLGLSPHVHQKEEDREEAVAVSLLGTPTEVRR